MWSISGYAPIQCMAFHQLQPRDMTAPITRGMSNALGRSLKDTTCRITRLHRLDFALSQTSPCFYVSTVRILKTHWEKEKLLLRSDFFFPTMLSILLENASSFSSISKLLSANSVWILVGWFNATLTAKVIFNATLTAKVISWRSVTHICFLAFSHQY